MLMCKSKSVIGLLFVVLSSMLLLGSLLPAGVIAATSKRCWTIKVISAGKKPSIVICKGKQSKTVFSPKLEYSDSSRSHYYPSIVLGTASPDKTSAVFYTESDIDGPSCENEGHFGQFYIADMVKGKAMRVITKGAYDAHFSLDSKHIVYCDYGDLFIVNRDGSGHKLVSKSASLNYKDAFFANPKFMNDGKHIVFLAKRPDPDDEIYITDKEMRLGIIDVNGRNLKMLTDWIPIKSFQVSADGNSVTYSTLSRKLESVWLR